jgi:hypothetical protein
MTQTELRSHGRGAEYTNFILPAGYESAEYVTNLKSNLRLRNLGRSRLQDGQANRRRAGEHQGNLAPLAFR